MSVTKTLAAAALAVTVTTSGAQAGMDPVKEGNYVPLIVAAIAGVAALLFIVGNDDEGGVFSTKDVNGTDGNPLPGSPSVSKTQVVMDF